MTEEFEKKQFILRKGSEDQEDVFSNLLAFLMQWKDQKNLDVTVSEYKKDRTLLQNNYLHGWIFRENIMKQLNESGRVIILSDGTEKDWSVDDLKVYFKQPEIIDQVHERKFFYANGEEMAEEVHPSKWPRDKFSKYCELIAAHAALVFDIYIPEPQSGYWLNIYNELNRGR